MIILNRIKKNILNKLLFIDGNDIHQMYTGMVFRRLGVKVDYIVETTNAMETYSKGGYDLILIDLDEHRNTGFDISLQIREFDSQIPIIGITDLAEIGIMFKALSHGMNYCVERTSLLETLNDCFDLRLTKDVA